MALVFAPSLSLNPSTPAQNTIQPAVGSANCVVLKANPSQSVRLVEWQKSDGTVTGGVGPGGSCIFKGFATGVNPKTGDYTANGTDHFIPVDATSGNVVITLPSAAVATPFGFELHVMKIDASGHTVTIARGGSDTVNGTTTFVLSSQYSQADIRSDGVSAWYVR